MISRGLIILFITIPILSGGSVKSWSYPGAVIVKNNEVLWGQYRQMKGIRGVEFPRQESAGLADLIKEWPLSGSPAVVLRCQVPGERFFATDGGSIPNEKVNRLRDDIIATNSFDMLPIVLAFDPTIECQLDSPEAYTDALHTLIEEIGSDCWYLLAISDQLDHPDWKTQDPASDPAFIARHIAQSIKEDYPKMILAAGSGSDDVNDKLFSDRTPLDVMVGRVETLGKGKERVNSLDFPLIETALAENVTDANLEEAVYRVGSRRIGESSQYGFALLFNEIDSSLDQVHATLKSLRPMVDNFQKETTNALPPSKDMNQTLDPKEAEEGFVSLFNGKDLSGWVPIAPPGDFVVRDGSIQLDVFSGGWLRSWEPYDDFVFRGEYWIEEGGNSGFFIRAPLVGRCSRIGFEFQMRGQPKDVPITNDVTGSIYDVRPPDGIHIRPNDWNEVEIHCEGPQVKIVWNGEVAHHFTHDEVDAMRYRALSGYIGLQDHHNEVKFRNLRIKKLN